MSALGETGSGGADDALELVGQALHLSFAYDRAEVVGGAGRVLGEQADAGGGDPFDAVKYPVCLSECADAVVGLSRPSTVFFGGSGGHPTQIFTTHPGGRVSIRLRQDELAQFSTIIQHYLPRLSQTIRAHQMPLSLAPGQGYLLDNERWLHARTPFTGSRLCHRALGTPLAPLPPGFPVTRHPGYRNLRRSA
ncbi:hypothetical protein [Streptomyces sp. JV176]|uniref:hypothetical protein n=1 Tax=Streptomyces sp. JV176 TaxID=858630 RepID=UPI002E76409B|nr:hypothetical protein [Streptomyces sp. JV176]